MTDALSLRSQEESTGAWMCSAEPRCQLRDVVGMCVCHRAHVGSSSCLSDCLRQERAALWEQARVSHEVQAGAGPELAVREPQVPAELGMTSLFSALMGSPRPYA